MANSATVGILRVLLSANTAEFDAGLAKSRSALNQWSRDINKIGQSAQTLGAGLTKAFTVPLLALGAGSIKAASDFQSSFAGVRKTVQATEAEFAQMEQAFRDLAKTIPINVNELNRLGEAAGALGIPKAEIVDFARVMAELGVTTNVTSDQAAEGIAKIQNIFGAAGKSTENFGSTLVALGNAGASTEDQILSMATRIAGAGNAIGLTQGEVLAFASALSSVGLEAEAGGTAISRVFIDIASAVSQGGDALEGFAKVTGDSIEGFSAKFKTDAAGAVNDFIIGLSKVKDSGGDLLGTLDSLGFSEIRVRDALLRAAGAGNQLTDALRLQEGAWRDNNALTEEAKKRYGTFESQLKLFWAQVRDVGIEIGTALLPTLTDLLNGLKPVLGLVADLAKEFAKLPKPVREVALAFGVAVAAIGPVLFVFGQLAISLAALTNPATIAAIVTLGSALKGVGLAAVAAAPQLLLFVGAAYAVIKVGEGVRAVLGRIADAQEQESMAGAENARVMAMVAEASKIAGRQITDYREAVAIVIKHSRELTDEQRSAAAATEGAGKAAAGAGPKTKDYAEHLAAAAKAAADFKRAQDELFGRDIVQKAGEYLQHLGGIENATKLTEDKQRELNQAVTAALDVISRGAVTVLPSFVAQLKAVQFETARLTQDFKDFNFTDILDFDTNVGNAPVLFSSSAFLKNTIEPLKSAIKASGVGRSLASELFSGFTGPNGVLASLPKVIIGALQGGGSVFQAVGSVIGGSLGENISGSLAKSFPKFFAGTLGKVLGDTIPVIGSLLGPLLGKLFSSFGISKEVLEARKNLQAFQETLRATVSETDRASVGTETWKLDVIAVRDAFLATGRSADAAYAIVRQLWDTDNPDRVAAAITEINKVLAEQKDLLEKNKKAATDLYEEILSYAGETGGIPAALRDHIDKLIELGLLTDDQADKLRGLSESGSLDWKQLTDDVELFKGRIDELGPAFQQARIDDTSKKYLNAIDRLLKGGMTVGAALFDAKEELTALGLDAQKTGAMLPLQFKDWLQNLIDTGQAIDENGNQLKDLSGIKFGAPMETEAEKVANAWQKIIDKIDEFISKLMGIPKEINTTLNLDTSTNGRPTGGDDPTREPFPTQDAPLASAFSSFRAGALGAGLSLSAASLSALSAPPTFSPTIQPSPVVLGASGGDTYVIPVIQSGSRNINAVVDDVVKQLPRRTAANQFGVRTALVKILGE